MVFHSTRSAEWNLSSLEHMVLVERSSPSVKSAGSAVPLIYLRLSSSNSGNRNRRIKKKGGAPMELVGVGKGVQR